MQWWKRLWVQRRHRAIARHAPPSELWETVLGYYPFLARLTPSDQVRLKDLVADFLSRKQFSGAQGLVVTDLMAVSIAAQACLPVLNLSLDLYDGFIGIVLHLDEVVATRDWVDDDGVVHEWEESLSGETMDGGPLMLSWTDATLLSDPGEAAYNVVIHEFAHVLDMGNGWADGTPSLPTASAQRDWQRVMECAFQVFETRLAQGLSSSIDPYGAESIDEFFAVACETFFTDGAALRAQDNDLYELLAGYFRQDPTASLLNLQAKK